MTALATQPELIAPLDHVKRTDRIVQAATIRIEETIAMKDTMSPEEIKQLRAGLGETQAKFGARFGKKWRTVSRWENDETHPEPEIVRRMRSISLGASAAPEPLSAEEMAALRAFQLEATGHFHVITRLETEIDDFLGYTKKAKPKLSERALQAERRKIETAVFRQIHKAREKVAADYKALSRDAKRFLERWDREAHLIGVGNVTLVKARKGKDPAEIERRIKKMTLEGMVFRKPSPEEAEAFDKQIKEGKRKR